MADIYRQAQAVNPGILAASQKEAEAEAKVREMVLQNRPELVFGANAALSRGNLASPQMTTTFYAYQGQLTLNLPDWAKNNASIRAASIQLRISQLDLQKTGLDLALQSEGAYYSLLQNRDAVTIAQQNFAQAQRQWQDTQKRVQAGDVPQADELKAEVPELQAQEALTAAQSQLTEAEQTLNSLLGRSLATQVSVAEAPPPTIASYTDRQVMSKALSDAPEVLEAEQQVAASEAALALAKRGNDALFSLQATGTHTSDPTTWSNLGSIGISVTVPLFDNGILKQQIRQAQLEVDQAKSALSAAKQTTLLAAASALSEMNAAKSSYEMSQKILAIAEESSTKAVQAYQAGLTTTRDVLDAQVVVAQARNDVNNSKYSLALASAKLKRILGEVAF